MKTTPVNNKFFGTAVKMSVFVLLLSVLPSCHHSSNFEDDTFKESIVDDPARANRRAIEKDKADSAAHRDSLSHHK